MKTLKQILLDVRNGAKITPAIAEIEEKVEENLDLFNEYCVTHESDFKMKYLLTINIAGEWILVNLTNEQIVCIKK